MNNITIQQQQISQIDELKEEFKKLMSMRETTYVRIGQTLNLLQAEMKEEGKLMEWLKSETRLSYSSANRYMRVAEGYKGNEDWAVILGVKKAYLLLKISDKDERFNFMKQHQVSKKSYEEIKALLMDYLNKEKKVDAPKPISTKSAINKLKKTIDKEIDNYSCIIDEMGQETPMEIFDINDKLKELQELLMNIGDEKSKTDIDDAESPISVFDEEEDDDINISFDDIFDEVYK